MSFDHGIKLEKKMIICPYCYRANQFNQGQITITCPGCKKGYFRDLPFSAVQEEQK